MFNMLVPKKVHNPSVMEAKTKNSTLAILALEAKSMQSGEAEIAWEEPSVGN